jgi:small-conductance mechanosensitive channel
VNTFDPLLLSLWKDLHDVRVLWQVGVAVASVAVALGVSHLLGPRMHAATSPWEIGLGGLRRLVLPLTALALVVCGRWALAHFQNVGLLNIAVPLLTAMAIIRIVVYVLRFTFAPGGLLFVFEHTLAWLVWIAFALHVLGLSSEIIEFFDGVSFHVGKQRITLLLVGQAILWVVAVMLLALWIGRMLEARLMTTHSMDMTLRVMLTKLLRPVLVLFALLVALPAVGIDLTALSVFGGALGVGIGFGLQKIASNYISGFIILFDRSVKIGDHVTVDSRVGEVTAMTARYIVVRSLDGVEAIIPNETMITSTVVNDSYSDRMVRVAIPVQISYRSDLNTATQVLLEAARSHPRALQVPAPGVLIMAFADSGINLELGVWISDPEQGKAKLRSDIYGVVWREFRAKNVEIPYPQREVRLLDYAGSLQLAGEPAAGEK